MHVGRNERCPCGSGKKYKSCCEGKASQGLSKGMIALLVAIAAIAAVGIYPMIAGNRAKKDAAVLAPAAPAQPRPQLPGPAPAGKVWSAEHGHWHDAAPAGSPGATATQSPIRIEQSTGPAAPTGNTAPITVSRPQPPGEAPPGKVWSAEHGHWHDATATTPAPPK